MIRALPVVLVFLVGASFQQPSIDREKLELIRKMSPEERARLKARLEEVKKLPRVERDRLQENLAKIKAMPAEEVKKLNEKAFRLSKDEAREYGELASGFFAWARRSGTADGFPRGLFFAWLKNERDDRMREIRSLEPGVNERGVASPRVDAFIKLSHEFRQVAFQRVQRHVGHHKCADPELVRELQEATTAEFWPKFQDIQRGCQGKRSTPVRSEGFRKK